MENYKVKVNNEAESKEVIFLGEQLGYVRPHPTGYISMKNGGYVCLGFNYDGVQEDLILLVGGFKESDMNDIKDYKEITIPQLRDMVVLKRNDVGDATHINCSGQDMYEASNGDWYLYHNNVFKLDGVDIDNMPKPIEKKEMKEYLIPDNYGYRIAVQDAGLPIAEDWIEIPEGANICINGYFYKNENTALIGGGWMDCHKTGVKTVSAMINTGGEIIWQRSEIESLSDQCVGIEQVRQDTIKVTIDELKQRVGVEPNKKTVDAMKEADALFADTANNPSHYSNSNASELKHSHYKKDVSHLKIVDVYRVLELFDVKSHAIGHAIKKLLLSGGRGAKNEAQDIQEAIDSLIRYQEMKNEDE